MQEAIGAKEEMHGRMACGRPLVVRLASEKYPVDGSPKSSRTAEGNNRCNLSGQPSRSAKIVAIKNKLKAIDEESHKTSKKQKQTDEPCTSILQNPPETL